MTPVKPLNPDVLCMACDAKQFKFKTTADLEMLTEIIGQERAIDAVRFGIRIRHEGYNLYVLGPHGTGKFTAVRQYLEHTAASEAQPFDWCYVHNFAAPQQPRAIKLPLGQGNVLCFDMEQLVEELQSAIPALFESDDYQSRRNIIQEDLKRRQEAALDALRQQAEAQNIAPIRTQTGLGFAPMRDGQILQPEDFQQLPKEERTEIETRVGELQDQLQTIMESARQWEKETRDKLKALDREVTNYTIKPLLDELRKKYKDLPATLTYLDAVQQDVVEHADDFRKEEEETAPMLRSGAPAPPSFRRYQVNVIVDHSETKGAPVVYEDYPVYHNLVGRVEHMVTKSGAITTDFNLINAGALHKANGGYLILDAHKVAAQPFAWEQLKRILRSREIRIESVAQISGAASTITLQPQPIPLDVKLILLGDRMLYNMLAQFDPDFDELFKVAAEFEEDMDRTPENNLLYARLIGTIANKENLRHFDPSGVARVIEYSSRLVSDSGKLATRMQSVADLLREADYWASEADHDIVKAEDVQKAIDTQKYRVGRIRERVQEQIQRETILIDTVGERVGQINGLSVLSLGHITFGRPNRITASVRLGRGEVIDVEREVQLGGPLHAKGVLILSSFLGARYALNRPLSLKASLVFEQSYGGVDGDSASSAELYALLSALANVPIKQTLAVTGSVNQLGQVQAIGGVNEKIEGFFDVCNGRGLTGDQGVLIPASNVKHLMLRQDVVEAARQGQFHIYPVETIDQGIEILTGLPAGEPLPENGKSSEPIYPSDTINGKVEAQLIEFSETWQRFSASLNGTQEHGS